MLVTIIVITYNSSKYVLETLESAYRQTYRDIELIVSDDCSTDNTFELCQQWVEEHKGRFVRTLCTQTPHNGGIVWNYNHALKHAQGEWIKYIAGDDILCNNCIERYVANIQKNIYIYSCITEHKIMDNDTFGFLSGFYHTKLPNTTAFKQTKAMLIHRYCVAGSSLFFERNHLLRIGGFDEHFNMLEDWPIVMRFLTNGFRLQTIYEPLVIWRIHSSSVSYSNSSNTYNIIFSSNWSDAINYYSANFSWKYGFNLQLYSNFVESWIILNSQKSTFHKLIGYLLRFFDIDRMLRKINHAPLHRIGFTYLQKVKQLC